MPHAESKLRRAGLLLGLLFALATNCPRLAAAEQRIAIIAHPGERHAGLARGELASIFRRSLRVDARGLPLVPVNLTIAHPLRVAFARALFGGPPEDMEAYWNERYFHGVSPPPVVASIEAMLRFVAVTAGAIGYVPLCAVDARVDVVATLIVSGAADVTSCDAVPR